MNNPIRSIGIIMDGNRRWAKAQGLLSIQGHKAGADALTALAKEFPRLRKEYGVEFVTLYTFSTENWNRSPEEVSYLLELFEQGMQDIASHLDDLKIRVRAIGDIARFPDTLQATLRKIEAETAHHTEGTVAFALSYGGRGEIVDAVNRLIHDGKEVTEEDVSHALWTHDIPDPDLIIRTSGESRLSNFLPWQSVYSELFFTETLWPDFTAEELEKIFHEYYERERRHGK